MPTFLHAADVHLDSAPKNLERYEGAPVEANREVTRRAFVKLVDLAIEEEVAFLVLAGDLYDGDWKDFRTGLFFNEQMSRLKNESIQVFVVKGNHDAASVVTRHLEPMDNVHVFDAKKAETVELEDVGAALHGRSYGKRAETENLSATYPKPVDGMLNVGVLHTSVNGREGHENYAPCSMEELKSHGYDYWALGHVHKREVLSEDPWVVFPGNLQGRHARETGPKGASLVEYSDGDVTDVKPVTLDVFRWERLILKADDATSLEDVLAMARAEMIQAQETAACALAVRIEIVGSTLAHADLIKNNSQLKYDLWSIATDCGDVWVEKVKTRTRSRMDRDSLRGRDDAIGYVVRALDDLETDPDAASSLAKELDDLYSKMPPWVYEGSTVPRQDDTEVLNEALQEAKELLLARLIEGG